VWCGCHSNSNARRFDGQNLVDFFPCKAAAKLPADFIQQADVHLVIQKAVHLQHISFLDLTVLQNSLL